MPDLSKRCFLDVLNIPEPGLALILVTAKNKGKEIFNLTLRDAATLMEWTVQLPVTLTLREVKIQARALFHYDENPDDEDEDDVPTRVFIATRGMEDYESDGGARLVEVRGSMEELVSPERSSPPYPV